MDETLPQTNTKKWLLIAIISLFILGLNVISYVFIQSLQPAHHKISDYRQKIYIGDLAVYQSKKIDWLKGEVLVVRLPQNQYKIFLLEPLVSRGHKRGYIIYMKKTIDILGYCGYSHQPYPPNNPLTHDIIFCNFNPDDTELQEYTSFIYNLAGKSLAKQVAANDLTSPKFYSITEDNYLILDISKS